MFYLFILLSKGANNLNERKGQGSIARGIVNLTGRWAKKRREKLKRKQQKKVSKRLSRS